MRKMRSVINAVLCLIMVGIIVIIGYNIAVRYFYPQKYKDYVEKYSTEYGVPEELVYAVIKCESNFNPKAQAGNIACGLMQLTEETFNDVRKMVDDGDEYCYKDYRYNAEVNIKYGTRYLKYLLDIFEGDKTAVIASYNAGMGNVRKWIGTDSALEHEKIRFGETSDYVKRVLKAEKYYTELYD